MHQDVRRGRSTRQLKLSVTNLRCRPRFPLVAVRGVHAGTMGRRGRPRIVRTPSEEREYQLRRKEARRARIRNLTEEQRAIVRSKEAAAKRRRRESNAALRQRENEAQRRRRQNPKVCQREAGMMGRRGRPRIVRTPSEEREYQLRRKEARRARMRNLTEEQRAILKQRAIEAERRRRQNPKVLQRDAAKHRARREDEAVRRREAEAKRRRRENPEIRQLEAAKRRARRADEAVRLREAEAKRRRRQNPEIRLLEAAKRRARREDEAVRLRDAETNRRRRQNPEVRLREAARYRARREAEAKRRRRQNHDTRQQEAAYGSARCDSETEADWQSRLRQRNEISRRQYACDVCFCTASEKDLSSIPAPYMTLLAAEFPNEDVASFLLCCSCRTALRMGALCNSYAEPACTVRLCENHSLCSNDGEDSGISVHSFGQQICERWIHEGKADCSLQTDGTGKVSCPVQTEESVKVIAVQTEEWPWPEFHEPTCDEADYKVEYQQPEDWL